MYAKVIDIIDRNNLRNIIYVEPFVGGAGLAIKLLLNECVSAIAINDIDPSIYAFWYSVLNYHEALCEKIEKCDITLSERDNQLQVLKKTAIHTTIDVGFATLFLNRTNVSGILSAGPIGGKEQNGKDKLNARFNKTKLIEKIQNIAANKHKISLFNMDVIDFIDTVLPKYETNQLFVNYDPPYVSKGQELYINHFTIIDHQRLRDKIALSNYDWIVTYDYNKIILELYRFYRYERIQLNHSAGNMKKGEEIIIYSPSLIN